MFRMLLAVDGSNGSRHAAACAARLARAVGSVELHVLNVQEPSLHFGMVDAYVPATVLHRLQTEAGTRAVEPAQKLFARAKVPHETHLRVGPIARTIVDTATELDCDVVVMGTRGMTAAANVMLSSIPTRVVHATSIPVMLVPEPTRRSTRRVARRARRRSR